MLNLIFERYKKRFYNDLKGQLKIINKHFKQAKKQEDVENIKADLTTVYEELRAFEEQNKSNIGYTAEIENAVNKLYSKIDVEQVKYCAYYYNEVYWGDVD